MRGASRSPDRLQQRPRAVPRAVLLALFALLTVAPALPAGGNAEQAAADNKQALCVRRAFREDAELKSCDEVGVTVRGTVAILWGKVPSEVHRQRALFVAGRVKGVAEVRAERLVVAPRDDAGGMPSPFPDAVPPPGVLAGNRRDGHTTQAPKSTEPAEREPVGVTLQAPVPTSQPTITQPPPPQADLASSVEVLRQKDERFRRVKVEVRQKTVYLSGLVRRWDDINDLSGAVRRLPGVEAVILDNVRVDGSRGR
jgi:osmotically-inducible protein OsmY